MPRPFSLLAALALAVLMAGVAGPAARAGVTPKKLAALEPRHETRMQRHEERLRRMEGVVAAYDPSARFAQLDRRIADLGARHDVRVGRGAALADADALARDAALDRPPGPPGVTPWIPKPPRR
jgi:hypothetical protein